MQNDILHSCWKFIKSKKICPVKWPVVICGPIFFLWKIKKVIAENTSFSPTPKNSKTDPEHLFINSLSLNIGHPWIIDSDGPQPRAHSFTCFQHRGKSSNFYFFCHRIPRHNRNWDTRRRNKNRYWTCHFPVHRVSRGQTIAKSWNIQKGYKIHLGG